MSRHDDNIYDYNANKPAALLFFVLYTLLFLAHIWQAFRGKTLFMIPLLLATAGESVGYISRYFSITSNTVGLLIISQVLIICAPAFLAAQCYMIVGRMIAYVGPGYSIVKHNTLTKIFVTCDIIAILTQSSGGAMLSNNDNIKTVMTGRKILIGGLALQVVCFGIFFFIAVAFDIKSRRGLGAETMRPLRPLFTAFYINAVLITGRSIYRTIEFAMIKFTGGQQQGYAITHEWLFYVFDSVPIFFATIAFNFCHPSKYLPAKKGLRLDGTYEMVEKRGWFGRKSKNVEDQNPSYA